LRPSGRVRCTGRNHVKRALGIKFNRTVLQGIGAASRGGPPDDAPGVYTAPEVKGIYWPQVGITLLLGSAAVALGFAIFEIFGAR